MHVRVMFGRNRYRWRIYTDSMKTLRMPQYIMSTCMYEEYKNLEDAAVFHVNAFKQTQIICVETALNPNYSGC